MSEAARHVAPRFLPSATYQFVEPGDLAPIVVIQALIIGEELTADARDDDGRPIVTSRVAREIFYIHCCRAEQLPTGRSRLRCH